MPAEASDSVGMRTTVDLPESLLRTAKRLAASRHSTLSAVVEDALRKSLSQKETKAVARFHLHTVRGKLVQPRIDLDRTSTLVVADDEEESHEPV
jgi:hypothetical protein